MRKPRRYLSVSGLRRRKPFPSNVTRSRYTVLLFKPVCWAISVRLHSLFSVKQSRISNARSAARTVNFLSSIEEHPPVSLVEIQFNFHYNTFPGDHKNVFDKK